MKHEEVLGFLSRFQAGEQVRQVFLNGCCFWFAVILHCRFPGSIIVYDQVANHFAVLISGRVYDITGERTDGNFEPWSELSDDLLRARIIRDCILF